MVLGDEAMEKATYLNIPTNLDRKSLQSDVRKGAKQFGDLKNLVDKENEPKFIIISTDNREQGYMAVTYLQACFNRKHGVDIDCEWDGRLDRNDEKTDEWSENELHIPVIMENELMQGLNNDSNDPFAMGGMFVQYDRQGMRHKPYWMNCTNEAVCIVSETNTFGAGGFGVNLNDDTNLTTALAHFNGNNKVYIILVDNRQKFFSFDDEEDLPDKPVEDWVRGKWNYIVLSYAADEVAVKLDEESKKKYYKLLFQGFFAENDIMLTKGFSYEKLVNMMSTMSEENKCQLTEKIVKYAIKDWNASRDRFIKNSDFAFMDRFCRMDGLGAKKQKRLRTKERMMTELIGMEDVKKQVFEIVNVMKYNRIRSSMNLHEGTYHNVHVMLGAPGTAKTTVAQMMGQMMVDERLLPDDRYICVNGAELKGMYVGHSAPKVKTLFEENDIIVIDEAYSLVGDDGHNDSFSKEALAQLIIEIENHSTDKLVIFAGYGGRKVSEKNNKMKDFLDANPGIKSRITSTIYFDSYNAQEMVEIFMRIAKNQKYKVDERTRPIIEGHFKKRVSDDNFGNGREARSLLETSVLFAANRIFKDDKKKYTKEEMQTITYDDVAAAIEQVEKAEMVQNPVHSTMFGFK
jgi:AAA+ superfamily predicted ATPase